MLNVSIFFSQIYEELKNQTLSYTQILLWKKNPSGSLRASAMPEYIKHWHQWSSQWLNVGNMLGLHQLQKVCLKSWFTDTCMHYWPAHVLYAQQKWFSACQLLKRSLDMALCVSEVKGTCFHQLFHNLCICEPTKSHILPFNVDLFHNYIWWVHFCHLVLYFIILSTSLNFPFSW